MLNLEFANQGNQKVNDALPILWQMFADKGAYSSRLRYLYTRREALGMLMGFAAPSVDYKVADATSENASDEFKAWAVTRGLVQEEILQLESSIVGARGALSGNITATSPLPTGLTFDPNSTGYIGSPLISTLGRN